jgi:hypothetical protein
VAEIEGIERDLQGDRSEVEALRETWQSWSTTLAQAQGAPANSIPAETRGLARQILRKVMAGTLAVAPYKVIDGQQTWTFQGYSRFDGVVLGGLTRGFVQVIELRDRATNEVIKATWDEALAAYRFPTIAGGSDAPDTVCASERDTEMAPKPPTFGAPRRSRDAPR